MVLDFRIWHDNSQVENGDAPKIPQDLQKWIDARKRHRLTHAQVQMARELGMNPQKLGKLDNHKQERWKQPLPEFIEELYQKRFGKDAPDEVVSIEEKVKRHVAKKAARKQAKAAAQQQKPKDALPPLPGPEVEIPW